MHYAVTIFLSLLLAAPTWGASRYLYPLASEPSFIAPETDAAITPVTVSGSPNHTYYVNEFENVASSECAYWSLQLPKEYVSTPSPEDIKLSLDVTCPVSPGGAADDNFMQFSSACRASGETFDTASLTAGTAFVATCANSPAANHTLVRRAGGVNDLVETGCVAGKELVLKLCRIANDVDDTHTGTLRLIRLRVEY